MFRFLTFRREWLYFLAAIGAWLAMTPENARPALLPVLAMGAFVVLALRMGSIWAVEKASCVAKLIEYTIDAQKPSNSVGESATLPAVLLPTPQVDDAGPAAQHDKVVLGDSNAEREPPATESGVVRSRAASK